MDKKTSTAKVKITRNGPYLVEGGLPLAKEIIGTDAHGESVKWVPGEKYPDQDRYALCRCGHSAKKPFCDGSHAKVGFDGTETASRDPYLEQATVTEGPVMSLTDVEGLCAFARFCDPHGQVWNQVNETDRPEARAHFVRQTCDCPSGRLVAWDNATGKAEEPAFEPSIRLIEDPANKCAGPVWLRGGVQVVGADGFEYEVRNRVTLCRCGASQNKPFCDGSHAAIGFKDED
ncbi:MAG TPA: CDGSH iron-sulfur domain-containing protein [Holophagaceae bacterium]|jgi:CDGSH-type Zn-finger protein|nr:CDGSH iron-sulfur domain-containing protein [Holophagaceae bacterium]